MRDYVNLKGKQFLIEIKLQIVRKWLYKLGFEYKNIKKDIFIDMHQRSDIMGDYKRIFRKIEEHKLYLVEFNENGKIKDKIYLSDCVVDNKDY